MTDQEIIQLFKDGKRERAFTKLYGEWPKAKLLVRKMGGSSDDARDLFHDALFVLLKKLEANQFTLSGSLNGFLYHTTRILCLEKLRKENKTVRHTGEIPDEMAEQEMEDHSRIFMAERALEKIAEKCRDILHLFYHEKRSLEFIAKRFGLKSEQAAKTQKYKCLEAARNEFKILAGKEAAL